MYLVESPKLLYEKGEFTRLRRIIGKISRINGTTLPEKYQIKAEVEFIAESSTESEAQIYVPGVCEMLKHRIILTNFIICVLQFMIVSFCYYLLNFYVKYVGGNIFLISITQVSSEIVAYFVSAFVRSKFSTKWSFIGAYIISLVGAVPLLFINPEAPNIGWAIMLCVIVSKFGTSAAFHAVYSL
jgi:Na+/melibiose symporter-like transporter